MFGLKGRQDGFRMLLPKEFLVSEVEEKYAGILKEKIGYFDSPIDFLNETIQKVNVLGFQEGTMTQDQASLGAEPTMKPNRIKQNKFQYAGSQFNYRSGVAPIALTDKTFNITFRHTLGYLNYFMLFENFWYQFSRDMNYEDLPQRFTIDLFNEKGINRLKSNIKNRIVVENTVETNTEQNNVSGEAESQENSLTEIGG